jgi:protein-disulfide isomerase
VAVKLLQQHYGKDLRFVFRNFPLTQLHPEAVPAAETAEFAGVHGRYWEAHDALYENQAALVLPLYESLVKELGLSAAELRQALAENTYLPKIKADFDGGVQSGVAGTPTFFINGDLHQGSSDLGSMAAAIEAYRLSAGLHRSAHRSML